MCLRILLVFPRGGELQTPATGTYIWLINNSILVRKADRNTSSDDDVGAEVISFSNSVVDCEIPVLRVPDAVLTELAFAGASAARGAIVVLRVDNNASLLLGEVGNNVAPAPGVMDTKCDDEPLSAAADKAEGTGRAAAAHRENVFAV